MNCGALIGSPNINAFIVGETFNGKIQPIHIIKNENGVEKGKVQICLFPK